jgi:hypothetical protein
MKRYEVEWSYTNKLGYCYTEHEVFINENDQQKFAFKKFHEENVYEVRKITEEIWRKD